MDQHEFLTTYAAPADAAWLKRRIESTVWGREPLKVGLVLDDGTMVALPLAGPPEIHAGPPGPNEGNTQLGNVIDRLYASEINFHVAGVWDDGIVVELGDEMNGFVAETHVKTSAEAAAWLDKEVRERYPNSVYAGGKGYSSKEGTNGEP